MFTARLAAVLSLLLLVTGGCGEASDLAADSAGSRTTASEPRGEIDSDSRSEAAVDALVAEDMPADEQALNRVLDALPAELLGRARERSDGEVIYRGAGEADLFLVAMEAEDVGTGETNAELLESEARQEGRVITDRRTAPSEGVMYIRGTEGSGPDLLNFLAWTTDDGPYLFAAGADTPEALDAIIDAFAKAVAAT